MYTTTNIQEARVNSMVNNLLLKIWTYAASHPDGFTIQLNTKPVVNGFAVAVKETQNSFNIQGLKRVLNFSIKHNCCVGGWFNKENCLYYFDSVVIFENEIDALNFARINNQLAIFNLTECKEIFLSTSN